MTRAELEQVRARFALLHVAQVANCCEDSECGGCKEDAEALALLDAELAKPEAREWRVKLIRKNGTRFTNWGAKSFEDATEITAPHKTKYEGVIESRTPAGPWERAK